MALPHRPGKNEEKTTRPSLTKGSLLTVVLLTSAMLFSKILGMLRSVLFASAFGATDVASAYVAASKIPTTLFDLFFAPAISVGMITAMGRDQRHANRQSYPALLLLLSALPTILFTILAKDVVKIVAPGLSEQASDLCTILLRILLPTLFFCTLAYEAIALLQYRGSYLIPALISTVSGIASVAYLIFSSALSQKSRMIGMAILALIGWMAQAMLALLSLLHRKQRPSLRSLFHRPHLISASIKASIPAILVGWSLPTTMLLATARASLIASGGTAIADYALSLFSLACALIASGVITYLFPPLSRARGKERKTICTSGLIAILTLTIPAALLGYFLCERGICVLYLRGSYLASDAKRTAQMLKPLMLALPAAALSDWLCRVCLTFGRYVIPVIASLIGLVLSAPAVLLAPTPSLIGWGIALGQITYVTVLLFLSRSAFERPMLDPKRIPLALAPILTFPLILSRLPLPTAYAAGLFVNLLIILACAIPATILYVRLIIKSGIDLSRIFSKEVSS